MNEKKRRFRQFILPGIFIVGVVYFMAEPVRANSGGYVSGKDCVNYILPEKPKNNDALLKKIKTILQEKDKQGYMAIQFVSSFSKKYCKENANMYLQYINNEFYDNLENALQTVVHETYHTYTTTYGLLLNGKVIAPPEGASGVPGNVVWIRSKYPAYAFYFMDSGHHTVRLTRTFAAQELVPQIPKEFRTFRFDPYIDPESSSTSTQEYGVYGLLDEFHAYYHGFITGHNVMDKSSINTFNVHGAPFYEFKFFILKYLIYAQKKHPEIYKEIINNADFKKVFLNLHDKFESLVKPHIAKERKKFLKALENEVSYSIDGVKYLPKDYAKAFEQGSGFKDSYTLKKELEKPVYQKLMQRLRK
ncbi:MAG: hypothetical protein ABUK01_19040 [Leptospirales bacterium]